MARRALLLGLLLAVIIVPVTLVTSEVYDDPWILYRYAANLADGAGWTFNPGEATANAVTSPLTVLLLAAATAVGVSIPLASAALFAVAMWATGTAVATRP
jgi:hypothetical protein